MSGIAFHIPRRQVDSFSQFRLMGFTNNCESERAMSCFGMAFGAVCRPQGETTKAWQIAST